MASMAPFRESIYFNTSLGHRGAGDIGIDTDAMRLDQDASSGHRERRFEHGYKNSKAREIFNILLQMNLNYCLNSYNGESVGIQ